MLRSMLIGSGMMLLTTFVHAAAMMLVLRGVELTRASHWAIGAPWRRPAVVAVHVVVMFVAAVIEAALWAVTYLLLGAITEPEKAMYFSTVTYTTLGYGDVVLEAPYRVLGAFQAANGTIMFGWTTAVIVWAVTEIYRAAAEARKKQGHRDV